MLWNLPEALEYQSPHSSYSVMTALLTAARLFPHSSTVKTAAWGAIVRHRRR